MMRKIRNSWTLSLLMWGISIFIFVLGACVQKNADGSIPLDKTTRGGYSLSQYHLVVIDSCEYIASSYALAHKGNCKFCAERRKKETKSQ